MTSSTGWSGLTLAGSPPSRTMPSRIAARSTTHGTPVKSCSSTRAGMKEISRDVLLLTSHFASASMSACLTKQVLEQDLQRKREARNAREAAMLECQQAVHVDGTAAGRQRAARSEAVHIRHDDKTSRENLMVPRP